MDSLTHIALGACIGEAILSKKLGKKALVIGALAQSFPDIDAVGSYLLSPTKNLIFHRTISHSLFFEIFAAFFLALLIKWIFKKQALSLGKLFLFFCLQLWLHSLLDSCNDYGTALFAPFSDQRFYFNLLFVADPFFSIPLILSMFAFFILKKQHPARRKWLAAAFILPCLYLGYAVFNKLSVSGHIERSLEAHGIVHDRFQTKPTAFNTWLWYVMVPADSGYYIGYRSVFDSKNYVTPLEYFPKNQHLIAAKDTSDVVQNLVSFSDDYYTIENRNDSLIFNVLRFGRIAGWDVYPSEFTFQYYLDEGFDNSLMVQRGRLREWNRETFKRMYHRIRGRD